MGQPLILINNPNADASNVVGRSPKKYGLWPRYAANASISCLPNANISSV